MKVSYQYFGTKSILTA